MRSFFAKLIRDIKAATAVEYGLICALIVLAMIAGLNDRSTDEPQDREDLGPPRGHKH